MDLRGAVVAVTGASRGIGLAVARELERRGATVAASSRSGVEGTEVVDLRHDGAVATWVSSIVSEHGRIDAVVHAAGVAEDPGPPEGLDPGVFARIIDVNLAGTFRLLHAALPHLKRREDARIVVVASRAARRAHPLLSAYSASKFGTLGLCQAVAR